MGEVVAFLLFLLAIVAGAAFAARALWRRKHKFWAVGFGVFSALVFIGFLESATDPKGTKASLDATPAPAATQAPDDSNSDASSDNSQPDDSATDAPTERPRSLAEQKRDFLQDVDESISGARIAGNPYKFVGDDVDLHCTVQSIPNPSYFNATCGTDSDGMPAIIVVKYDDTSDLEQGQAVRVIGTVIDPVDGTNLMGGARTFPTVEAHFME